MSNQARFVAVGLDTPPDSVLYQIIDPEGLVVYSSSTAEVESSAIANGLRLMVTYDVPATLPGGRYNIVFTIAGTGRTHSTEIDVEGARTRVADVITLDGTLGIVGLPVATGTWSLYRGNDVIQSGAVTGNSIGVAGIGTQPGLDSMLLVIQDDSGALLDVEVFHINASILKAVKELRVYLDRLNRELRLSMLEFDDSDYMHWLAAGRDRFNSIPIATDMSMTAASGPIRSMWLVCSQIAALRTRYLEEGLTSYNYGGASVTLDVDVTQYIESQIQALESRIESEGIRLKTNMNQRGLVSGSGQWTLTNRAVGATGITLGPVSGRGTLGLRPLR